MKTILILAATWLAISLIAALLVIAAPWLLPIPEQEDEHGHQE